MEKINLCVPTLNRYDCLLELIKSAILGTRIPDRVWIIDNGGKLDRNILPRSVPITVVTPNSNVGVATSWNWFITHVSEIRLISNDDILFLYNAIEEIEIEYSNETLVSPIGANIFSCFTIPDSVINHIGYFDESISPGYGYYEDTDFARRLYLSNISIKEINKPLVQHAGSSTLKIFTPTEMNEHHRKFKVARSNYELKWGGDMGKETHTEVRRIESLNNMIIVDRWDNDSILER